MLFPSEGSKKEVTPGGDGDTAEEHVRRSLNRRSLEQRMLFSGTQRVPLRSLWQETIHSWSLRRATVQRRFSDRPYRDAALRRAAVQRYYTSAKKETIFDRLRIVSVNKGLRDRNFGIFVITATSSEYILGGGGQQS